MTTEDHLKQALESLDRAEDVMNRAKRRLKIAEITMWITFVILLGTAIHCAIRILR